MGDRPLLVEVLGVPAGGRALGAWLAEVAPAGARGSLTVAVTTDARVRALNRRFRGVSKPTDVLSFPADEPGELGDIVIARGVAARQARDLGHSLATELRVLALHGLLHLLGYDHEHGRRADGAGRGAFTPAGRPRGRPDRADRAIKHCAGEAKPPSPVHGGASPALTPLALFLVACATVFLGTVQTAFGALMRLSLRLMAERGGRDDELGGYLDDPPTALHSGPRRRSACAPCWPRC